MKIIFILIGISVFVAGGFLILFIWAVQSGQYDDNNTPPRRILHDND